MQLQFQDATKFIVAIKSQCLYERTICRLATQSVFPMQNARHTSQSASHSKNFNMTRRGAQLARTSGEKSPITPWTIHLRAVSEILETGAALEGGREGL